VIQEALISVCDGRPSKPRLAALHNIISAGTSDLCTSDYTEWFEDFLDMIATRNAHDEYVWSLDGKAEEEIVCCIATVWTWLKLNNEVRYGSDPVKLTTEPVSRYDLVQEYDSWKKRMVERQKSELVDPIPSEFENIATSQRYYEPDILYSETAQDVLNGIEGVILENDDARAWDDGTCEARTCAQGYGCKEEETKGPLVQICADKTHRGT